MCGWRDLRAWLHPHLNTGQGMSETSPAPDVNHIVDQKVEYHSVSSSKHFTYFQRMYSETQRKKLNYHIYIYIFFSFFFFIYKHLMLENKNIIDVVPIF